MQNESFELSPFQREKLQSYFKFLGPNEKNVLESHSIERLMERVYKYTGWKKDNPRALQCLEIHTAFYEILFEKSVEAGGGTGTATLNDWYAIWCNILPGCKGMSNFPMWLRLMPQVLFDMIDRKEDKVIDVAELKDFYKKMLTVTTPDRDMDFWVKKAFDSMTDNERYPLNLDSYEQIFANFLIGRTPHGPGKYIFGCFQHENIPFQLIQVPMDADDAKDENAQRRPRKFGVLFS